MIDCWLAKIRSIWTLAAFGRTSAVDGSSEGSFSVCPADDFADLDPACVAFLSNLGPEVNSNKVLVVVRVVGMSWDAEATLGIGVEISARPGSGTTSSITKASACSVSILSGAAATL